MLKLFELGDQQPEAKTAHLVLLALKERPQNYKVPVLPGHSASAGNALAQIQLQVRLYTQSILQNQILCSFLGAQARTSKSVAPAGKATTYPPNSATTTSLNSRALKSPVA